MGWGGKTQEPAAEDGCALQANGPIGWSSGGEDQALAQAGSLSASIQIHGPHGSKPQHDQRLGAARWEECPTCQSSGMSS